MNWSKNSGYGQIVGQFPFLGSGKIYIVGDSGTANRSMLAELFNVDVDGVVRFFSTIDAAIGSCVANAGDYIYVMPGHTETLSSATSLNIDVAGMSIIGLGRGLDRPVITLDTATTTTIPVSAANIRIENLVFSANYADIVAVFTVAAAKDFQLSNCLIKATATNMNFKSIVDTGTTSNAVDGLTVVGCDWVEPDAATLAPFLVDGTNGRWNVSDNFFVTGAATADKAAMFTIATGKVLTGLKCLRNYVQITGNSGTVAGLFLTTDGSTNTGLIAYNMLQHADATTEIFATASSGFGFFENKASGVAGASGYLLPAADA